MRFIAVFSTNLSGLNDEFGGKRIGVFPVYQDIGSHFAENGIPDTDSFYSLKIERIGQMLTHERHDSLVALNKIGGNQIPVIISVQIDLAQNQVSPVMRYCRHDDPVVSKQQYACQGNAAFTGFRIGLIELSAFQQFQIVHAEPGVVLPPHTCKSAAFINKVRPHIFKLGKRIDFVL